MCCGRKQPARRNTGKKSGLIKGNIKPIEQNPNPIHPPTPPYGVRSS